MNINRFTVMKKEYKNPIIEVALLETSVAMMLNGSIPGGGDTPTTTPGVID